MKYFNKFLYFLLGAVFLTAGTVFAINISVPQAPPSAGYMLISTSTGAYVASSTIAASTANFGVVNATSTSLSSIANLGGTLWVPSNFATAGCAGDPTKTDFGACVNALNAKLVATGNYAGQIMVPPMTVTQAQWTTPINFSGPTIISFDCVVGAKLEYGGTATSTLFNMSNPTGHLVASDDYGCLYMGHSTLIAQGQTNVATTVGVGFGGSNGAVNIDFHDNSVNGFGQDLQVGQNAYMITIANNAISGGNGGRLGDLLYNDKSNNSGEALTLSDNTWTDPANNLIGNDIYFSNASLASADISGKSLDDAQIFVGTSNGTVSIHDLHIENSACGTGAYNAYIPILGVASDQFTHINLNNIEISNDCSGAQSFATIISHGGQLYASGIHIDNYGGGTITNLVLHSLDNGLEAETVCKVDVASGGLTNIIGGSGAQAYSLAAGNTCIMDTSNSYAISMQAHQNNIATFENGSQDVGTFDNNGKWTFLSGINTLSSTATNNIGGSLFSGAAPIAGLGTSNSQFVISQNVNNLARQIDLANINMGANAEGGITFENGNSTNAGASSAYIGGLVMGGPNFATVGFSGLSPNGLALFNTDGNVAIGATSLNPASSSLSFYAGNNAGFGGANPDMVLKVSGGTNAGGNPYLGLGTTTPEWLDTLYASTTQQLGLGSSPTNNIFTLRSVGNNFYIATASPVTYATSSVAALRIDPNGKVIANCFSNDGSTCITSGGGSGTVSSGLAGQLGYYNVSGTTIVGTSTAPLYVGNLIATSTNITTIANLGNVYDATAGTFAGADIGAEVDNVYSILPLNSHGTANIPRGTYNFSTEIVENTSGKTLSIACDPGTVLHWTGSGTSTLLDWGQTNGANSFVNNCKFTGTGPANNQIALEIGKTNGVRNFSLNNVEISAFGSTSAVVAGSNAYLLDFNDDFVHDNGKAFMDQGSSNFGEAISFNGGAWGDCNGSITACVDTGTGAEDFEFNSTSFDSGQVHIGASTHRASFSNNNIESSSGDSIPTYIPVVIDNSSFVNVTMDSVSFVQGTNVNCPAQDILNGGTLTFVSGTAEDYNGCHVANFITNTGNGWTKMESINKQDSAYTSIWNSTGGSGTIQYSQEDNGVLALGTSSPQSSGLDVGGYYTPINNAPFATGQVKTIISDNVAGLSGVAMTNINTGTSADFALAVLDSTGHSIQIREPQSTNNGTLFGITRGLGDFLISNGGTGRTLVIGNVQAKDVVFGTNNVQNMILKSGGFFGIGTTTPSATLDISQASSTAGTLQTTPFGRLMEMTIQGVWYMVESFDYYGHLYTSGPTPSVSGGTSSMNTPSNDQNGSISVVGTALTSVTMTFAKPWLSAPSCQESDNVLAVGSDITSISSTQVVFGFGTGGVASATIWYKCTGNR